MDVPTSDLAEHWREVADISNPDINDISLSRDKIKEFAGVEYNNYISILYSQEMIGIEKDMIWIMDNGIFFYSQGGFIREWKKKRNKIIYNTIILIAAIVSTMHILISIFNSHHMHE